MENKFYGETNRLNLKLMIALSRATQRVHKRSAETFSAGGLTTAQFAVLDVLYHKGSQSINQIIQSVLSTGGNMTVVINNLVKNNLIARCVHPDDKRSNLISITESGKEIFEAIFPAHLKEIEVSFEHLSDEEKIQLVELLKKIGSKNS
jgi:MarR family 2-MHQ and catechol resistance regulon transcriptional repressor